MPLLVKLRKLNVELGIDNSDGILAILKVRPMLMERIVQAQKIDHEVGKWYGELKMKGIKT